MDGVAAEVAKEIGVLLQHHHLDAGTGKQIPQHHAGRAASGDATSRGEDFGWHGSDSKRPRLRHSGASRNLAREAQRKNWIPAFAGMTAMWVTRSHWP